MRAFLAVDINQRLTDKISKVQKQIMGTNAEIKYVEPENLHFTFKFFGEISEKKSQNIMELMDQKIKNYHPFELSIKGVGVFPHPGYVRVIWLGVDNADDFSKIQMECDEEFIKMGFKKERSYNPHLTIGRVKGAKNKDKLLSLLKELETLQIGKMEVERISLKKSELTPAGPIYTTIKVFEL